MITGSGNDLRIRCLPDILGEMAAASITTNYQTVLTTPNPWVVGFIKNNTNATLYVRWDGSSANNNHKLAAGQSESIDLRSNAGYIPQGTLFQVKYTGSAPTTGDFVVEGVYPT